MGGDWLPPRRDTCAECGRPFPHGDAWSIVDYGETICSACITILVAEGRAVGRERRDQAEIRAEILFARAKRLQRHVPALPMGAARDAGWERAQRLAAANRERAFAVLSAVGLI